MDDFSLGDLTDRITELEEETAKGLEAADKPSERKPVQEDYVPRAFPPFPELRYLNLAHNQVSCKGLIIVIIIIAFKGAI